MRVTPFFLLLLRLALPLVGAIDFLSALKGGFNKVTGILDVASSKVKPFSTIDEVGPFRGVLAGSDWGTYARKSKVFVKTATRELTHSEAQLLKKSLPSPDEQALFDNFWVSETKIFNLAGEASPSQPLFSEATANLKNDGSKIKEYVRDAYPEFNAEARHIEEMKFRNPELWLALGVIRRIGETRTAAVESQAQLQKLRVALVPVRRKIDRAKIVVGRLKPFQDQIGGVAEDLRNDVEWLDDLYDRLHTSLYEPRRQIPL